MLRFYRTCLPRLKGSEGLRVRQNALGLGLLLGAAVFAHGRRCGCKKAEILAINDDGELPRAAILAMQPAVPFCMHLVQHCSVSALGI
jgi:hypothetical protein